MTAAPVSLAPVDVLASDGRIVHLRPLGPHDGAQLRDLHARTSDRSIYLRYFSPNRAAADRYAAGLARDNGPDHHGLGAFAAERLVAVGVFDRLRGDRAEFGLLVADEWRHRGLGTLLLEYLVAHARSVGITAFVGEVLAVNAAMVQVVHDLGLVTNTDADSQDLHVVIPLAATERFITALAEREQAANAVSLRPLLAPRSIAVIGAGRRRGSVGHEVLRNILDGGFSGSVHVVNPHRSEVLGVASVPSPALLPEPVDLAIIALPAPAVLEAVRACGERGCRTAVLLGSGFGEVGPSGATLQQEVLAVAREHDLRLVGPNCIGVANTNPAVRLDATFGSLPHRLGPLAVVSQSGAFGVGLVAAADASGLGISQFVSVGNKIDVGGNDLLMAWAHDPWTRVIAMYLESIGDARRFVRIAARVARQKPVIAVKSGSSRAGRIAGQSHTAAAASSDIAIDALLRRAGVVRVAGMRELLAGARLLADQPLPGGPRVAVVGNSGGPEILTVDALSAEGLTVAEFGPRTRAALERIAIPARDPIDLGAEVSASDVEAALGVVTRSPDVDAVIAVFTDLAINDAPAIDTALRRVALAADTTLAVVRPGGQDASIPLPGRAAALPVFGYPEDAAKAMGLAYRYARIRRAPVRLTTRPRGVSVARARSVVEAALEHGRSWLTPEESRALLSAYRVPMVRQRVVSGVDAVVAAADALGYPVVLKLAVPGLHKTESGGVRLDLADADAVREAAGELTADHPGPLLVQPMITGGTEFIIGAVRDPQCGPLVMVGAGGILTDLQPDRRFGLAPLTEADADELIGELHAARLLEGYRGRPALSRVALRHILVKVGALVDDLPEISELDLNPVIGRADGWHVVDARIRIAAPGPLPDPLERRLR